MPFNDLDEKKPRLLLDLRRSGRLQDFVYVGGPHTTDALRQLTRLIQGQVRAYLDSVFDNDEPKEFSIHLAVKPMSEWEVRGIPREPKQY